MLRLLWKEIYSSRLLLGLAAVVTGWVLLIGDPLWFRGDTQTDRLWWFMVIFLLLGLRAYSTELGDDTVGFLYSRPVKWWQILLAKLASGVIFAAFVLLLAGSVYAAVLPEQYRPFLWDELMHGMAFGAKLLIGPFLLGMMVSMLMPGTALSFASLVGACLAYAVPQLVIREIGLTAHIPVLADFGEATDPYAPALVVGAAIGGILAVRRLPGLDLKQRWRTWLGPPIVAFVLGSALGMLHVPTFLGLPVFVRSDELQTTDAYGLSPDGEWAVYGAGRKPGEVRRLEFVVTKDGRVSRSWDATEPAASAWSHDSRRFAYLDRHGVLRIADVSGTTIINTVAMLPIPPAALDPSNMSDLRMSWSPNGSRLGFIWDQPGAQGSPLQPIILTFDTCTGAVRTMAHPADVAIDKALSMPSGTPVLVDYTLVWPPGWGPVRK